MTPGVSADEHHRLLPVRRGGRVGLAHGDQHGAAWVHRTAGPPLAPGDDVLIAVPLDPGGDVGRVAARHVRLGHGEGRADAPGQQRLEPGMFLLLGAQQVQQLHVAGIGCLTVDRLRSQVVAPARQLRDRRVLQLGQPGLGRQEQIPQAVGLCLLLELLDDGWNDVVVRPGLTSGSQVPGLGRQHVLVHEDEHAVLQLHGMCRRSGERIVSAGAGHGAPHRSVATDKGKGVLTHRVTSCR